MNGGRYRKLATSTIRQVLEVSFDSEPELRAWEAAASRLCRGADCLDSWMAGVAKAAGLCNSSCTEADVGEWARTDGRPLVRHLPAGWSQRLITLLGGGTSPNRRAKAKAGGGASLSATGRGGISGLFAAGSEGAATAIDEDSKSWHQWWVKASASVVEAEIFDPFVAYRGASNATEYLEITNATEVRVEDEANIRRLRVVAPGPMLKDFLQ